MKAGALEFAEFEEGIGLVVLDLQELEGSAHDGRKLTG